MPIHIETKHTNDSVTQVKEGLISREEALMRVDAKACDFFLHPYVLLLRLWAEREYGHVCARRLY